MSIQALRGRDFLSIADFSAAELTELLQLATDLKQGARAATSQKVLGLLFSKASTRTRVSFSVAMYQLGGQVIDLNPNVTQVGRGEPISDTARVLDRYLDILAVRTFHQADVAEFARYARIPVINALTDLEHPCQILADLLTVQECFGRLAGVTLTYLGDGNNVAHSLLLGCALVGLNIRVATPAAYAPNPEIVEQARSLAQGKSEVTVTSDAIAAVQESHVLYTDVWASMGQEAEAETRLPVFQSYQINGELLSQAASDAIVLHCLPAHRDEEISDAAMEGSQARIWQQAENRMHAQKALLAALLDAVS